MTSSRRSNTADTIMETNTWPQLAEGLYGFLTGRGATLEYSFDKMEIWVPRDTTLDAPQARWQVNGSLRIRTIEPAARPR